MPACRVFVYEPYVTKLYGNTRYLIDMFRYADSSRVQHVLVTPRDGELVSLIRDLGGKSILISPGRPLQRHGLRGRLRLVDWLTGGIALLGYSLQLAKLFRRERPDVVQCHSIRAVITVSLAALLTRRRVLWYIKGDLENRVLDTIGFLVAAKILFQCEATRRKKYPALVRLFKKKIAILPNGIDLDAITSTIEKDKTHLMAELGIDPKTVRMAYVGYLNPYKGVDYLLLAMVEVLKSVPNAVLYLVGDYCLDEHAFYSAVLDQIISDHNIANHVRFTGYRNDVLDVLSLMDVFVLPSRSEGVPTSIMEAMALGKPVVATRVGGVEELVKDGTTGFLVEPADSDGLAQTIITLARDEDLRGRFGKEGQRIALKTFSIRDSVTALQEICWELRGS